MAEDGFKQTLGFTWILTMTNTTLMNSFVTKHSPPPVTPLKEVIFIFRVDLQISHDYLLVAIDIGAKQRPRNPP